MSGFSPRKVGDRAGEGDGHLPSAPRADRRLSIVHYQCHRPLGPKDQSVRSRRARRGQAVAAALVVVEPDVRLLAARSTSWSPRSCCTRNARRSFDRSATWTTSVPTQADRPEKAEHCHRLGAAGTIDRRDFHHWGQPPAAGTPETRAWSSELRRFGRAFWDVLGERRSPALVFEHPGRTRCPPHYSCVPAAA